MPEELFRTEITSRDPRHASIMTICSYSMAGIFLGMFLTLSGVMLTAMDETEHHDEHQLHLLEPIQSTKFHHDSVIINTNQTLQNDHQHGQSPINTAVGVRKFFGLALLISGCLLIIFSLILLMFASLLYLRTTTRPPVTNDTDPETNTVWNYLDSMDQAKQIQPQIDRVPSV